MAGWLWDPRFASVPLFVSRRRLELKRRLRPAAGPWALDSGGFTELQLYGRWQLSAAGYSQAVVNYQDVIGQMVWAAPQDWMCEPQMVERTGLSVAEHQRRTVVNLVELRARFRDLGRSPSLVVPVIQGWSPEDYLRCVELYEHAGIELGREPIIGVGSVVHRQATTEGERVFRILADKAGLRGRLHGFGVKTEGVKLFGELLGTADSLAWSFNARRNPPLPGHTLPGPGRVHGHRRCSNCPDWALQWRERLLACAAQRSRGNVSSV